MWFAFAIIFVWASVVFWAILADYHDKVSCIILASIAALAFYYLYYHFKWEETDEEIDQHTENGKISSEPQRILS